jgi:hypothetical protein
MATNSFLNENKASFIAFIVILTFALVASGFFIHLYTYDPKDSQGFFTKMVFIFFFIVLIIFLIWFILFSKQPIPESNQTELYKIEKEVRNLQSQIQAQSGGVNPSQLKESLSQMAKGERGPIGPAGPQGKPGGMYQWQGPLRNLQHTKLRLERMYATGPNSVIFLNNEMFTPAQTWYYNDKNQLVSHFNDGGSKECVKANNESKTVEMGLCNDSTGNPSDGTQWFYNANGQFQTAKDNTMCMDLLYTNAINGTGKVINSNTAPTETTLKDAYTLVLKQCNQGSGSQVWSFY